MAKRRLNIHHANYADIDSAAFLDDPRQRGNQVRTLQDTLCDFNRLNWVSGVGAISEERSGIDISSETLPAGSPWTFLMGCKVARPDAGLRFFDSQTGRVLLEEDDTGDLQLYIAGQNRSSGLTVPDSVDCVVGCRLNATDISCLVDESVAAVSPSTATRTALGGTSALSSSYNIIWTDLWGIRGSIYWWIIVDADLSDVDWKALGQAPTGIYTESEYFDNGLRKNPSCQWRLGESSGSTSADESGNGNTITWDVTPTRGVAGAVPGSDTAMTFDGTMRGDFPDDASWKQAAISIECWVKRSSAATAAEGVLDAANTSAGASLGFLASGNIEFAINNGAGVTDYAFPADGVWHHIVGTYSTASGLVLYLDGAEVATDAYSTAISWTSARQEVGSIAGSDFLDASLDELTFHTYELSAVEIKDSYEKGAGTVAHIDELIHDYFPAAYYRMGNASGNTRDETGAGQDITWTGSPTYSAAGAFATLTDDDDDSITLNGSSQYGTIANTTLLQNLTDLTIGFWVNTTDVSATILDKISTGAAWLTSGYYIELDANGSIEFQCRDTSTYTVTSTKPVNDGDWHFVVCTFDSASGVQSVYIDGRIDTTGSGASLGTNTAPIDIGASVDSAAGTSQYLAGSLDELQIYPHNLSPFEITKLFNYNRATAALQTKEEHLLSLGPSTLWRMSELTGDVALDHSSNQFNMTWASTKTPHQKGESPTLRDIAGGSCVFDGDHYGDIPDEEAFEVPHVSVEAWVRRGSAASAVNGIIDLAAAAAGYYLRIEADGDIGWAINQGAGVCTYPLPMDDEWHHVVGTYSPDDGMVLYLDGVSVDTDPYSTAIGYTSMRHEFGRYNSTTPLDDGTHVGDVLLYNYVLSAAQVLVNNNFAVLEDEDDYYGGYLLEQQPVALWRLGEASGATSADETIFNNLITWDVGNEPTRGEDGFKSTEDADTSILIAAGESGDFPDTVHTQPVALTIEAWVKRAADSVVVEGVFNRYGSSVGVLLGFNSSGDLVITINAATASYAFPSDGNWHHIAGVYGPFDEIKLYLDGAEVATTAYSTAIDYTGAAETIGYHTNSFLGGLDEVALFPYVKSPSRILADYSWTSPTGVEPPAAPSVYPFRIGPFDVVPAYLLGMGMPALQIEPNPVDVEELPEKLLGDAMPAFALVPPTVVTPADEFIFTEGIVVALILNRADGYSVTETFTSVMLIQMFDSFGFESARGAVAEFQALSGDSFSFDEFVQGVIQLGVSDAFAFAENSSVHAFLVSIADTFGFSESFVAQVEFTLARSDSSGWSEEYIAALQMGRSEQFALAEALVYSFTLLESVSDSFAFTETRADQLYLAFSRSEDVGWGESLSAQLQALVGRADSFGMMGVFSFVGGEKYMAWVVHPKTKAPYKFRNYPFTGFATTAGRVLACGDDGIYQLTGNQDAGAAIKSTFLRTRLMNLGTELTKRLEEAYLAYSSTGETLLKVIFSDGGEKTESWYKLGLRTRNTPGQAELPIHRGIESVYYQFELALMDGKPTRIEQFTLLPMVTTRMI